MKWHETFLYTLMIIGWVFGIAASAGFWQTFFSFICPPYSWVVISELLI